jgi:hypothetical protein
MRKIWQTYKYIYYWLYTWQRNLWGKNDFPEHNASIGLSLSFGCNSCSLFVIIDLITGIQILPLGLTIEYLIAPIIFILGGHYFLFVFKQKYKNIEEEFKSESKEERKKKGIGVLLYTFGSLAFYIFLLFFGIWINS